MQGPIVQLAGEILQVAVFEGDEAFLIESVDGGRQIMIRKSDSGPCYPLNYNTGVHIVSNLVPGYHGFKACCSSWATVKNLIQACKRENEEPHLLRQKYILKLLARILL